LQRREGREGKSIAEQWVLFFGPDPLQLDRLSSSAVLGVLAFF
jgi:hypothetical protein